METSDSSREDRVRALQPVRRYRTPSYPTRLQILDRPQLLEKHLPRSWLGNSDLGTMLGVFLTASTLYAAGEPAPENQTVGVVAPIFVHGEGRGATGCIVVSPPVFLSEEEALQVIKEELAEHGVAAAPSKKVLGELKAQEDHWMPDVANDVQPLPEPITADLEIADAGVLLEFVSAQDYYALGGKRSSSTVQGYNTKGVAEATAERLGQTAEDGTTTYGVFYDPMSEFNWPTGENYSSGEVTARAESRRLLRQQVRDFVDWMRGQGVI